jgi:hypothetical protein
LVWAESTPETLNTVEGNVFDNFSDCYNVKLKVLYAEGDGNQKEFSDQGFNFFSQLETDMDCSGMCWTPLFGISRNISAGPVEEECMTRVIETLSTTIAPAVVCIVTFFILFMAALCSIPLCSGFDKDEIMGDEHA